MKKYDCNKTLDYVHEVKRLCRQEINCMNCPLGAYPCINIQNITEAAVHILQKWSDENPEQPKLTAREWHFLNAFDIPEGKRISRGLDAVWFQSNKTAGFSLKYDMFSFIKEGESMTFEELLELGVEE